MATVLVVDDNPVDRHLACNLVEKCIDMKAIAAANGRDAWKSSARRNPIWY
jgi:CheY-like chemotaxis protein